MAGRKSSIDKENVIDLFRKGLTYRAIALEVNNTEDAIRKIIKRNAPEELQRKKEAIKARKQLEESKTTSINADPAYFITDKSNDNVLDVEARIQLRNERRNCINANESIGEYSFVLWNRQSYLTNKKGNLVFDESRGGITKDVPNPYHPII